MTVRILALDIATRTGWAFGPSDAAVPKYGVHQLPKTSDGDCGRFFYEHREWLIETIRRLDPQVVVFECPVMPAESRIETLRKLYTLAGIVEEVCYGSRECAEEHLQSIKKFITGSGAAKKPQVVEAVNRTFNLDLSSGQDNEADALALWALTVHKRDIGNAGRFALGALGTSAARPRAKNAAACEAVFSVDRWGCGRCDAVWVDGNARPRQCVEVAKALSKRSRRAAA